VKTSTMTAGFLVEIRTKYLLNTSYEHYCFANPLNLAAGNMVMNLRLP
jgi:hypothetical protein